MIRVAICFLIGMINWSNAFSVPTMHLDSLPANDQIRVMARISWDSVQLRWAPMNFSIWQAGLTKGYVVDRYTLARNDSVLQQREYIRLTNEPIKVLEERKWEEIVSKNKFAAIAAQAIFGSEFRLDVSQGDFVSISNQVAENDQRYYFALYSADLSLAVANAQGLYLVDRSINKNEKYLYKVQVLLENDTLEGSFFVGEYEEAVLETPSNLKVECKNSIANLKWDPPVLLNYVGYFVERSIDSLFFQQTTDDPIVTLSPEEGGYSRYEYAIDSLDGEDQYYYRIVGQSIFGDRSSPSEVKSCRNVKQADVTAIISSAVIIENNSIEVEWECESHSAIRGFLIERASSDSGPYNILNAMAPVHPSERKFIDLNPDPTNYYRVVVLDEEGRRFRSHSYFAHLVDSVPPVSPRELSGSVDEFGIVQLRWEDNRERDLFGFRVYMSNSRNEEMSQLTSGPIRSRGYEFRVNPRTLNDSVYFAVAAIDNNQNQSGLSVRCALALPDRVEPTAPVMLPLATDSTGVVISWVKSSSKDVAFYDVLRKNSDETHWSRIKKIDVSDASTYQFVDTHAPKQIQLLYTVVAIDDANLESIQAPPLRIKIGINALEPAVLWRNSLRIDRITLSLKWSYDQAGVQSFKLYKSLGDGSPVLYKTLNAVDRQFLDVLPDAATCSYQILAVFTDGRHSALSEKLIIKSN